MNRKSLYKGQQAEGQIDIVKDKVIDAYLLVKSVAGEGDEGGGDEDGVTCIGDISEMGKIMGW